MAGTIELSSFADNAVRFDMDYNDSGDVVTLTCYNETDQGAAGVLYRTVWNDQQQAWLRDGVQYELECDPQDVATLALDLGANRRIRLSPSALKPGKFDGYQAEFRYPF